MLPHFCKMYLKYLAGLCHHLAYIHHTHWVCMLQWSARKSWLVWCWFRKKRANKNKLLKKIYNREWVLHKMRASFFPAYFAWALIIMKAFLSHFICISHSGQQRITYRTKISVSHSFQMNGKKAYKLLLSDNSISILLRSSAVQHA